MFLYRACNAFSWYHRVPELHNEGGVVASWLPPWPTALSLTEEP